MAKSHAPVRRRRANYLTLASFGAAVAAVHELRYAIAYSGDGARELAAQGHGYQAALLPALGAAAVTLILATTSRALRGTAEGPPRRSLVKTWALCTLALATFYSAQELSEGALASGHPGGLAAFIGDSSWIGLALAVPAGLLVALAARAPAVAALVRRLRLTRLPRRYTETLLLDGRRAHAEAEPSRAAARAPPQLAPA